MADEEKLSTDRGHTLSPEERKRRSQRNIAIALMLAAFIALVYAVTIFRLGGSVAG
ncbi:MAG: hypothetical protein ACE5FO_00115 [Parvularculaceae bacterium]